MSVIVKGMEMPKKCLDCPFMISRDNDDCIVQSNEANAKFDSWDDMKASCPLVEIPTPHGRLIDADALKAQYRYSEADSEDERVWMMNIRRAITNAPTIIVAEGSEA